MDSSGICIGRYGDARAHSRLRADPPGPAVTRPAPTFRSAAYGALALNAAPCGSSAVVARGRWSMLASHSANPHDLAIPVAIGVWAGHTVMLAARAPPLSFRAFWFAAGAPGLAMIAPFVAWEALHAGFAWPAPAALAATACLALHPTLVAPPLFARGIERVGPVQAGLFTHLVPVFAALLATIALDERLQAYHAAGFTLVAAGAALGCLGPEREPVAARLDVATSGASAPPERRG